MLPSRKLASAYSRYASFWAAVPPPHVFVMVSATPPAALSSDRRLTSCLHCVSVSKDVTGAAGALSHASAVEPTASVRKRLAASERGAGVTPPR